MASKKQRLRDKVNSNISKKKQNKPKATVPTKKKKNNQKPRNVKKQPVNTAPKVKKIDVAVQKEEPKKVKIQKKESTTGNATNEKVVNKSDEKKNKKEIRKLKKELREQNKKNKKLSRESRRQARKELKQEKKELKKEKKQPPKEKSQKETKPKTEVERKEIKKVILTKLKNKKVYILFFVIAIILIVLFALGLFKSNNKIFFTFKSYKIGDKVTLENGSAWYSIEDSGIEKQDILLLSSTIVDVNDDKKIDDKDKVVFDSDNQTEYNLKKDNNIAYFINEKGKDLIGISDAKEIRLLTSDEYIRIRRAMNFGYDWKEGNWLAGKELKSWWLETTKYNMIYVVNERGSYKLSSPNSKNYLRVVIKINKSKIKQN